MIPRHMLFFPALAALFLPVQPAAAWNATGHQIIACIAFENLTPAARAKVTALLRAHADYAELFTHAATAQADARDQEAFQIAATWPDMVRQPGTPRYRYNHPAWHYIDFPLVSGNLPRPPKDPPTHWTPGADPANAAQAYEKCLADLLNEKLADADRAIALCWVEHLVGDIHQPLHAASLFSPDFPDGDKGGNSLMVTAGGKPTNLHTLWDDLEGTEQSAALIEFAAQRLVKKLPRDDVADQLAPLDFVQWAKKSAAQAWEFAYLQGKLQGISSDRFANDKTLPVPPLPPRYLENATNLADQNITLAGYRLAAVLNQAFSPEKPR